MVSYGASASGGNYDTGRVYAQETVLEKATRVKEQAMKLEQVVAAVRQRTWCKVKPLRVNVKDSKADVQSVLRSSSTEKFGYVCVCVCVCVSVCVCVFVCVFCLCFFVLYCHCWFDFCYLRLLIVGAQLAILFDVIHDRPL